MKTCSRYSCHNKTKTKYCSKECIQLSRLKTIRQWKNVVWKLFSEQVRKEASDFRGYVKCYTCNTVDLWDSGNIQAGHYEHGDYPGTWINPKNVKPQCVSCNKYLGGNRNVFAIKLEQEYGHGILQELRKRRPPLTYNVPMLKEIWLEMKEDSGV